MLDSAFFSTVARALNFKKNSGNVVDVAEIDHAIKLMDDLRIAIASQNIDNVNAVCFGKVQAR